jgi:SPP1 gp7 family putative phage head morphogenesis protein
MNVRFINEALRTALMRLFAEAWVTGEAAAEEAIYEEEALRKAGEIGVIDWSKWQPGDKATALLLEPKGAFKRILDRTGTTITGLDKTGYELVGTALADSIRAGYSPKKAAKLIQDAVGSPARALTIAVTESSRVMNSAAIDRYQEAGIDTMQWSAVAGGGTSVACDKCAENAGEKRKIGQPFSTGKTQPPQHPHCRCNLRPVVPDYDDMFDADGNLLPLKPNNNGVSDIVSPKPINPTQVRPVSPSTTVAQIFDKLPMTKPQSFAVNSYCRSGYLPVNGYLRTGKTIISRGQAYLDEIKDQVRLLKEVFDSALPIKDDLLVFRGVNDDFGDSLLRLKIGDKIGDKGFVSTSIRQSVAVEDFGGDEMLMEIIIPKGSKVISPAGMLEDKGLITGAMRLEQEVIINAGSTFEVVSKVGNTIRVVLING